ncbi:MAG: hypothetical protein V4443_00080 [Pseudomonadota bacterium]
MSQLRDIPPIRSVPYTLDAALYNQARLALLRIGNPLELELENLAIDLVLEKARWIGYHCQQISLPLIAWDGFDPVRSALDAPVACTMHLYHQHSWLQSSRILQALEQELHRQLSAKSG